MEQPVEYYASATPFFVSFYAWTVNVPGARRRDSQEESTDFSALVALQPVMDLHDRTVFGYEALPRGPMRYDARNFVLGALPAVQYTSPALLFVPLPTDLVEDEEFDPFTRADDIGAAPVEVAWLIAESTAIGQPELVGRKVEQLRERGFQVALADVAPGVLARGHVAELMPNFVFLDASFAGYVSTGIRARAELAGLLAYCARLNAHVIPRGIDDDTTAHRMIGLGVRLGIRPPSRIARRPRRHLVRAGRRGRVPVVVPPTGRSGVRRPRGVARCPGHHRQSPERRTCLP